MVAKVPELPADEPPPSLAGGPHGGVLIARLDARADLTDEALMPRGPERRAAVWRDLTETAVSSQQPALAALEPLRTDGTVTDITSLALTNALLITAAPGRHQAVTDALKGVAQVASVGENERFSVGAAAPAADVVRGAGELAQAVEWGVAKIGAPAVWKRGIDGTGVTVGVIDTGLDADHPAIREHYRGTQADGTRVDDYNWFDGIGGSTAPSDDGDHGTHVAGTIAGGTPERVTGVAPGAKIIAAKAIDGAGWNTTAATLRSLQWMLAPTKVDGSAPDPARGADVINNSWGTADMEDAGFRDSFEALTAAGIEVVTAAGNDGPSGKVSPPGSYPGFITVAATTDSDRVASFSSRGPSHFDPDGIVPNLAAPGQDIVSTVPGGRFGRMSGTSMASPHTAGAVALLLSAKPDATHDEIVAALQDTAVDIDVPGPDGAAGFGRVDVDAAVARLAPAE